MRPSLALVTAASLLGLPAVVDAQEECPPGGWFCEGEEEAEGDPGGAPDAGDVAGDADAEQPDAEETPELEEVELPAGEDEEEPPVTIYKPKGSDSTVVVLEEGDDEDEEEAEDDEKKPFSEWGFNLRLEAALLGSASERADDSGMGGLGFSFRYRPVPSFALDMGLDFIGGQDFEGNTRSETAFLVTGIIFFNPYDPVQVYTLGGFGFSSAAVRVEQHDVTADGESLGMGEEQYSYFGGHLGFGLEFRVSKRVALGVDLIGFMRGRTDADASYDPEFVSASDPTRTTNTSGGGLLRGGVTFYW